MAGRRMTIDLGLAQAGQQEKVQVNVLDVTKDHEVVEVGGFKMKRRKTNPHAGLGGEGSGGVPPHLSKTPYEQQERNSMATQRTPNVEELELSEELFNHLTENLSQLPENAQPIQKLLSVCGAVCGSELHKRSKECDAEVCAALDAIFAHFLALVKLAVTQGDIKFAPDMSGNVVKLGDEDLKVDLEARKAGLRNRLQMLKDEEREWHELLAKVEELDIEDAAVAEDESASVGAVEKYAAEEIAALRALRQDVHRKVTMQVDGVCMLVGNIEDLIDRAHQTAQEVHMEHHKKIFESFPHVDSPKFLIKKILGPGGQ